MAAIVNKVYCAAVYETLLVSKFKRAIQTFNSGIQNVQLTPASHRYREVTSSNPVAVLFKIFRLLCAIAKMAFITARIIASLECSFRKVI